MKFRNLKENYFLSKWIANLGVVPLLLFRAFLFAPDLTFLADLLFRVTRVFETIILIPSNIFRSSFLPTCCPIVKAVFILSLFSPLTYGKDSALKASSTNAAQTIVLSRGEQKQIKITPFAKISIGNKEVLAHKYYPSKGKLLLKGRRLGFTDLTVWSKSQTTSYHLYVFSKRKFLKMAHLMKQNQLIAEIYDQFLSDHISVVKCENRNFFFICTIPAHAKISKERKKYLERNYAIQFFSDNLEIIKDNFKATLSIFHRQSETRRELLLGTQGVHSLWDIVLNKGPEYLFKQQNLKLEEKNSNIETFVSPTLAIMLNEPATFQMGTEIPIQQNNKGEIKLIKKQDYYILKYDAELSFPDFSGTKEKSSLRINIGETHKIFNLIFKYKLNANQKMPLLGNIPLLGKLFTSPHSSKHWHQITGIIQIEEQ